MVLIQPIDLLTEGISQEEDVYYLQICQNLLILLLNYESFVKTHNTRLEKFNLFKGRISIDNEISQEDIEDKVIVLDLVPSQMIRDESSHDLLLRVSHNPAQDSTYAILTYLVRFSGSEFLSKVIDSNIFTNITEPDHLTNDLILLMTEIIVFANRDFDNDLSEEITNRIKEFIENVNISVLPIFRTNH